MHKKTMWIIVLTLSIFCTLVFIPAFITSIAISSPKNTANIEKKAPDTTSGINKATQTDAKTYNILSIGDSLAKGTGDEKGKGFVNYFADSYKTKVNKDISVNNLAVNGDKSDDLLKIVQTPEALSQIANSDLIFISIGGNEVKQFKDSKYDALSSAAKTVSDSYLNNLTNILKIIRNKNSTCTIIFIGLYNPFGENISEDKIKLLNSWNYQTEQLISQDINSLFIPTYDLFKFNIDKYLTVDGFHPNSAGYEAISKRISESMKN